MWPTGTGTPWFRIGRLEVTSVLFAVLLVVLGWFTRIGVPASTLSFSPDALFSGQVWRLVTWPLADFPSLFGALNLFFFYWFGTELEQQIGRDRMARFLVSLGLALMGVTVLVWLLTHAPVGLAGLGMVMFLVFLVWIADNPRRPIFFGIPAWVIGAVLLGIQVLTLLAARDVWDLLSLVLSTVFAALIAKANGLLTGLAWVPGGRRASSPRPSRPTKVDKAAARQHARRASDREQLDALLDRINENGIGSLTEAERKKLMDLRARLRGERG